MSFAVHCVCEKVCVELQEVSRFPPDSQADQRPCVQPILVSDSSSLLVTQPLPVHSMMQPEDITPTQPLVKIPSSLNDAPIDGELVDVEPSVGARATPPVVRTASLESAPPSSFVVPPVDQTSIEMLPPFSAASPESLPPLQSPMSVGPTAVGIADDWRWACVGEYCFRLRCGSCTHIEGI